MAEDTAPAAETATTDETPSELVTWEDSEGRKHTGARSGSAYKRHLAEQKLASAAEKAEAAAKSADTAETPEVAADVATADAPTAAETTPAAEATGDPVRPSEAIERLTGSDTDTKDSAPKPGRTRTYGKV
ncbi:hypothetical protein SEA_DOGFISH_13 [Gordonia phage Dogfish]|nr:hypothetical protein SEA_DOGFISH_13 [Gordonia phage Dogfish]